MTIPAKKAKARKQDAPVTESPGKLPLWRVPEIPQQPLNFELPFTEIVAASMLDQNTHPLNPKVHMVFAKRLNNVLTRIPNEMPRASEWKRVLAWLANASALAVDHPEKLLRESTKHYLRNIIDEVRDLMREGVIAPVEYDDIKLWPDGKLFVGQQGGYIEPSSEAYEYVLQLLLAKGGAIPNPTDNPRIAKVKSLGILRKRIHTTQGRHAQHRLLPSQ